jgi:predicted RNase H-like HicB family nuclease
MQTLIRLKIEKFIEGGEEYFLATSDDLQGLVAEGKTVQEAIEIAEDVAKVLLDLEIENNHNFQFQDLPSQFDYPLIMEV